MNTCDFININECVILLFQMCSSTSFTFLNLGIKSSTLLKSEWAGIFGNHIAFYDMYPINAEMSFKYLDMLREPGKPMNKKVQS